MSDLYNPAAILEGLAGIMTADALTLMLVGIVASSIFAAIPGPGRAVIRCPVPRCPVPPIFAPPCSLCECRK